MINMLNVCMYVYVCKNKILKFCVYLTTSNDKINDKYYKFNGRSF